jgi:hypothetical protein
MKDKLLLTNIKYFKPQFSDKKKWLAQDTYHQDQFNFKYAVLRESKAAGEN